MAGGLRGRHGWHAHNRETESGPGLSQHRKRRFRQARSICPPGPLAGCRTRADRVTDNLPHAEEQSEPFMSPIGPIRLSEALALQLRSRILSGQLPVGLLLPTERDLSEQVGVSRGSVREAIRILEIEGLLKTKQGRKGGTRVVQPSSEIVARSLESLFYGSRPQLASLFELREAVEPFCARLAAVNALPDHLDELDHLHEKMREAEYDHDAFVSLNVEWHVKIASASTNELLAAIMIGVSRIVRAAGGAAIHGDPSNVPTRTLRAHLRITDAVKAKDPIMAERAMREHIRAHAAELGLAGAKAGEALSGAPFVQFQGKDTDIQR